MSQPPFNQPNQHPTPFGGAPTPPPQAGYDYNPLQYHDTANNGQPQPPKNNKKLIIGILAGVVAVLIIIAAFLFTQKDDDETTVVTPAPTTSESATTDETEPAEEETTPMEEEEETTPPADADGAMTVETLVGDKTFTIDGLPATWTLGAAGTYWSEDMTSGALFQYYEEPLLQDINKNEFTEFLEGFNSSYGESSGLGELVEQEDIVDNGDGTFSTVVYYAGGDTAAESATFLRVEDGALLISTVINSDGSGADEYQQAIDASRTIQLAS